MCVNKAGSHSKSFLWLSVFSQVLQPQSVGWWSNTHAPAQPASAHNRSPNTCAVLHFFQLWAERRGTSYNIFHIFQFPMRSHNLPNSLFRTERCERRSMVSHIFRLPTWKIWKTPLGSGTGWQPSVPNATRPWTHQHGTHHTARCICRHRAERRTRFRQ